MIHFERSAFSWPELTRFRSVPVFERLHAHIHELSSGDKVLFYFLATVVGIASLFTLYALEQSLLVVVPAEGGGVTLGEIGSPRFINPLLAISDADRDLAALTYAGLMGLTGDGSLAPVLAESYMISDDGKTYTFTLRGNAKFSDGTPVTAADVVFTIERAQSPGLKSPEYADWSGVRAAALDPRTVRFTLAKPYAPFLGLTTLGILPARLWQNISDEEFPFSNLQMSPVGAGPFKVEGISRDSSGLVRSVRLVQNARYVLGRPYLDRLTFNFYANSEDLRDALAGGAVESAFDLPAGRQASQTTKMAPYGRVFGVFFNPSEKQVFARLEVRKALSLAIDRQALTSDVLGGYATPIMGPVPPGSEVRQVPVPVDEDPTRAGAAVLRAAGWAYDSDARIWKHAGAKQTLESVTIRTSNVPELKNVATAVKGQWEKLGISVSIELYEPGDLSQNVIRPRRYEALLYGMVTGRDEDLYAFWDSQERNDPGLNIALYANKTVDGLLETVRSTSDGATRRAALQKIEDTIAAEYPAAFLYASNFVFVAPSDVRGIALPQIISPSDRFASVAAWYRATDSVWPFFAPKGERAAQ